MDKPLMVMRSEIMLALSELIQEQCLKVDIHELVVKESDAQANMDRGYLVVKVSCQSTGRKFVLKYESLMARWLEGDGEVSEYVEPFRYKLHVRSVVREVVGRLSV